MSDNKVIVRFPPSPTGLLHVGNVRTALYNYLFARKNGGKFIVRIEDTDKVRSKKEYEEEMLESLKWLGLEYDNKEIARQTERTEIYKKYLNDLIKKGAAYISEETEGENREVVRFRNPGGKIKFQDLIHGEVEIDVGDLKDFIIARNINEPLYHLAVVVDDFEGGITHVIRGDDHISNTPRQILILEAIGGHRPIYAHLPMILATDKSKLSKRKHGEAVSLKYYRENGYLPDAIINFLALIGWNPGTDKEIFNLNELIEAFDISKVQKKGGIFNIEKLNWVNREHILSSPHQSKVDSLISQIRQTKYNNHEKIKDSQFIDKFLKVILDRINRWGEVKEMVDSGEFDYLFEPPTINIDTLPWKDQSKENLKNILNQIYSIFESQSESIEPALAELASKEGKGNVFWPLRTSLSGREKSPDPLTIIDILGIEESKRRIKNVIDEIN